MNIVPTAHTRRIAQRMADDAAKGDDNSPADVTLEWLHRVEPEQYPALIGLLLGYKLLPGHVTKPTVYTEDDRREAHKRFARGDRDPWVVIGEREYQRVNAALNRKRRKQAAEGGAAA